MATPAVALEADLSTIAASPRFTSPAQTPRKSNGIGSSRCPLCGVDREVFQTPESPGKGTVRLLQSVIWDLEAKLQARDETIKQLREQQAKALPPPQQSNKPPPPQWSNTPTDDFDWQHEASETGEKQETEEAPTYSGRSSVSFRQQQQIHISLRGVRDVGHTEYKVCTSYKHDPLNSKGGKREVWHRYTDFAALHVALTARGVHLPPLPRKHLFSSHSTSVIKEREKGLLNVMHAIARDPSASSLQVTRDFLGLAYIDTEELPMPPSKPRTHTRIEVHRGSPSAGMFRCL